MPIRFKCPSCQKALVVREQYAGKRVPCPSCKKPIVIPAPTAHAADVEALALAALSDAAAAAEKKAAPAAAPAPPIEMTCPYCGEPIKFDASLGGQQAPCPNPECKRIIKVPKPVSDQPRDWRELEKGPSA